MPAELDRASLRLVGRGALSWLCAGSLLLAGCSRNPKPAPPPPPPSEPPIEAPAPTPTPAPPPAAGDELAVKPVTGEIIVAAWAEPSQLPPGGGPVQILVRVQKRGGRPYPGVEVRLGTSTGTLFSKGRTLVTDVRGITRDRLTAKGSAVITVNAGGTRYRFPVSEAGAEAPRSEPNGR